MIDAPPAIRWCDATTTLLDFSIVTWAVPLARLAAGLPGWLEPLSIEGEAGPTGLVSVVSFRNEGFGPATWERPRLDFPQVNFRVYVRQRGTRQRAVWFLGSWSDTRSVYLASLLWGMPWRRGFVRFTGPTDREWSVEARRGEAWLRLSLRDTGRPPLELRGFQELEDGLRALTHPLLGFYRRRSSGVGLIEVWHRPLRPSVGELAELETNVGESLGLPELGETSRLHSVLVERRAELLIRLPPRRAPLPRH